MQHSLFGVTIHPETSFGLATENYVAVLSDNIKFAQYTVYSMYIYIYTHTILAVIYYLISEHMTKSWLNMIKSVWQGQKLQGVDFAIFRCHQHEMEWKSASACTAKGPALGTWHRLTFLLWNLRFRSFKVPSPRLWWISMIWTRMAKSQDRERNGSWPQGCFLIVSIKGMYGEIWGLHYCGWRSATAMQAFISFISAGWDDVRCLWWRESLNFPPAPSLIKSQILTVHRPGWGPSFDHWS